MLSWALIFFVIALLAAAAGYGGVAGMSERIGHLFVVVAVIMLVISLLGGFHPPSVAPVP